jgi:eukaryotic-like serine/threonine-protein kinase
MVEAAVLLGRYRLEDPVASGGMGRVFVATDDRLGRRVAVKLLRESLVDDPRFVERFRREARSVAALNHPSIASVFDYGEEEGRHFIVMEYVEGRDLAEVIGAGGPLDPERSAVIGSQSCDALGHAHESGIVHRDVKPANIIVGQDDRVRVTDFGIAHAVGDSTLTATGSVMGTAHYLAPEQASGAEVGPAADQYAMGVVLFEMLTGEVPFGGTSAIGVAMRHVADEIPPPSRLNAEVPPGLDEIVATATAKDPERRYPSASRMSEALRDVTRPISVPGPVTVPSTAVVAGTTQVLGDTARPNEGRSSGPRRAVRGVTFALALLALAVAALLAFRLIVAEDTRGSAAGNGRPAGAAQRSDTPAAQPSGTPAAQPSGTPAAQASGTPAAPELVTIPDLVGLDYKDAVADLDAVGLEPSKRVDRTSTEAKDVVVAMSPHPGTELEPGASVTVVVSKGVPPRQEDGEGEDD